MLPVLCFCLPCLIRVLARIQDPMRGKGATPSMINKLPIMKYRQVRFRLVCSACPHRVRAFAGGEPLINRSIDSPTNPQPQSHIQQMQARNNAQQGNNPQQGAASQPANGPQPGGAGSGEAGAQGGAQGVSVTGVESNSTSCAICISEYALDEDVRLLPCSHYFHSSVSCVEGLAFYFICHTFFVCACACFFCPPSSIRRWR